MREIKFRGQIKDKKEWVYGTLLRIPAPPQCIGKKKSDIYYIQFADPRYTPDWNMPYKMVQGEVIPETIGQYTGLHDKNGKEIYEGDIIKAHYIKNGLAEIMAKVTYSEEYAQYVITNTKYATDDYEPLSDYEDLEIIGNIYENKELLED